MSFVNGIIDRTGVLHVKRPKAGTSARIAWDWFAEKGPIKSVKLVGGYWGCERPDGTFPDLEFDALTVIDERHKRAALRACGATP